jgi:hypothetical protein
MSKEVIIQELLGDLGLRKVYHLFNSSKTSDIRKLAGRLLCEATFNNQRNQDFLCSLFDFEPNYGRISMNSALPPLIKQKLANDKDFLSSINAEPRPSITNRPKKRYWSFPEFKELPSQVLQHHYAKYPAFKSDKREEIGRSVTHRRTKANKIKEESMFDYLNFPDP